MRRKNCTQIVDSAGLQDVNTPRRRYWQEAGASAKTRISDGNISPKSTVKSVHGLTAVIYDLNTTITAFKWWIPSRVCLRFKCSSTARVRLTTSRTYRRPVFSGSLHHSTCILSIDFCLPLTELRNFVTITASRHAAPLASMVFRGVVKVEPA
jgi:hypothetical protein